MLGILNDLFDIRISETNVANRVKKPTGRDLAFTDRRRIIVPSNSHALCSPTPCWRYIKELERIKCEHCQRTNERYCIERNHLSIRPDHGTLRPTVRRNTHQPNFKISSHSRTRSQIRSQRIHTMVRSLYEQAASFCGTGTFSPQALTRSASIRRCQISQRCGSPRPPSWLT